MRSGCTILTGGVLRCRGVWQAPELDLADFASVTCQSAVPAPVRGSLAQSGEQGTADWIPDVLGDPRFIRVEVAERAGLRAAFGFPIRSVIRVWGLSSSSVARSGAGFPAAPDGREHRRAGRTVRRAQRSRDLVPVTLRRRDGRDHRHGCRGTVSGRQPGDCDVDRIYAGRATPNADRRSLDGPPGGDAR